MKKLGLIVLGLAAATVASAAEFDGWTNWRGPHQVGSSDETGLPETVSYTHLTLPTNREV